MSQHFLLSAAARTLSLASVARMSDEEARARFQAIRWADNDGEPYCPKCGCVAIYTYAARPIFRCKGCGAQFSVTSGTIFANRKLPVRDYLLAIAIFANGAKGHSALQLSRDLDCQYKTAFVLAHKMREAMASETVNATIGGAGKVADIDGAYFGARPRKENKKADRPDRRLTDDLPRKRCVIVMRERGGRTLPFVVKRESDGVPLIRARVESGTVIHADESTGWDRLYASYEMRRVNHSVAYQSEDGTDTNWAESFFSRMRRAEIGVHHRINHHLGAYASEMAWREDHRRDANGLQHNIVTALALRHPPSRVWKGYWQRHLAA